MKVRQLFFLLSLCFSCTIVQAHPSYGLVVLENGTVYFVDVLHHEGALWKYTPEQGLSRVLDGVHSHYLFQDANGRIWGTDHDYIPSRETNRNSLWQLTPDEEKVNWILPTEDPSQFSGVNFVVDRQARVYFPYENQIFRRTPERSPRRFIDHQFGRIMCLSMDEADRLFVADTERKGGSLYRVDPNGMIHLLADELKEENPVDPPFPESRFNLLFGVNLDIDGHVYVANSGSRRIWKITPEGEKKAIYHSRAPWYPMAAVEVNGLLYVMEAAYEPGVGNYGPRIVIQEDKDREVLVEIGSSGFGLTPSSSPLKDPTPKGIPVFIWWIVLPILGILGLRWLIRQFAKSI